MSALHTHLQTYLSMRRGLGFKLQAHEPQLKSFLAFLHQRRAPYITQSLANAWATQPQGGDPAWFSLRLTMVRGFAEYLRTRDPRTELIPAGLIPFKPRRPAPYLYTQEDVARLLVAARALPPRARNELRPWTYYCLLGLLATTGLRIGEAVALKREDVDLKAGVLTIRAAKFGKSRVVPLHPSTQGALTRYAARRDAGPMVTKSCPYFFVGEQGRQLCKGTVQSVFVQLTVRTGLRGANAPRGPRLHDFRHSHAVQTLLNGYRSGQDTELLIPVLSTFLGHSHVSCTYWYLTACPELMEHAAKRLQARWEAYP